MKKVLALILSIVMALAVFVACNNNTLGSTQTSDNTTVGDNTVGSNTETSIETDKFDNINFDGATLSLSVRGKTWEEWVFGDEQGNVIYSSIYDANLAVDSFLNINRVINVGPEGQEEYAEQIATTIMAGFNTNDVVVTDMYYGTIYSTTGTYVNLKESTFGDYIDLEQDYWYREYIENTVVGNDQIFMLAGDISPSLLSWAGAMFFNYDKYESIIGDPDEFMRKVIAGEWYLNDLDT